MATQPLLPRPRTRRRARPTRERHYFLAVLEPALLERLQGYAEHYGTPLGPVVENIVGVAHEYLSPWAPKLDLSTVGVAVEALRDAVEEISNDDCLLPEEGERESFGFRLDEPLATRVMLRCDELDVSYGSYLRQVLLVATGLVARPVQLRLVGEGASP